MRTKLYVDYLDTWLMQDQRTLVNFRRRQVLPVLMQRQQLADALARYVQQLGLERKAKQIPSLQDYLSQNGRKSAVNILQVAKDKNLAGPWFKGEGGRRGLRSSQQSLGCR